VRTEGAKRNADESRESTQKQEGSIHAFGLYVKSKSFGPLFDLA